ncbi:hypothetical protein O1M54_11105 [Streptomyces diastatochromogenes]|nr:hypothetical protein [Streptomyces diastatochromogenes]
MLLRFVAWDERGFSRQSVRRASLDAAGLAVVEDLRQARLVTDVDEGEACDLVHEALLRHWPRLRELTERHRDVLRRLTDLERRAAAWLANDRSADDLLHGQRLAQARELVAVHGTSPALAELVAASRARAETAAGSAPTTSRNGHSRAYALRGERRLALGLVAAAAREFRATEKVALTLWGIGHDPVVDSLGLGHAGEVLAFGWDPGSGQLRTIGAEGDLCTWTARGDLVAQESLGLGELRGAGIGGDVYWVDTREKLAVRRFDAPEFWSATAAAGPFGDRALGLSPDGWRAAAQLAHTGVDIIDFTPVPQGRLAEVRHSYEAPPVKALAWSPDGSRLALFAWNELNVVRLPDGDPAWRLVRGDDELPAPPRGSPGPWTAVERPRCPAGPCGSGPPRTARSWTSGTPERKSVVSSGRPTESWWPRRCPTPAGERARRSRCGGSPTTRCCAGCASLGRRGDRLARRQRLLRLAVAVQRRVDR